jgi:cytochrome P450
MSGAQLPAAYREVPGPRGYPILGIIPRIGKDVLKFFSDMVQYGDLVRLDFGPRTMYLVADPEGIKYVLQDNNRNYTKGYDVTKPLIGNGLVTSEGDFWRKQRRLMQPMFHRSKVDEFAQVMVSTTDEIIVGWADHAAEQTPIDVSAEMTRLTQQVIARTMFSTEVGNQTQMYMQAFEYGLEYLNQRMFNPIPFLDKLPTPTNLRFKKSVQTIDDSIYALIEKRRIEDTDPGDLLSMLLSARDADTGEGMSDQQIRDEVTTIFFAGHETTASTLSWAWYLLAQHPEIEARLHEELDRVLAGRQPTAADYTGLVFTRLIIDEVLRLYPPAWMFARQTIEADEIAGYHIPAGSMIMLSPYVTHRHPAYWENPDQFDPERFLAERSADRPKYAYFPFGGGPRLCIGRDFALVEAALVLAEIAQRYRMRLVEGAEVHAQPIATLRPRPGVPVILEAR